MLIMEEKLKVLKNQESVKIPQFKQNTSKTLGRKKTDSEQIYQIYDRKEEDKKEHAKNHPKTIVILRISFSVIFVGIHARKKVFKTSIRT